MSRSFYKKRYKSAIVLKFFDSVYKSLQVIDGEQVLICNGNGWLSVGRMPHDIRIGGRIVGVRSTKQFVRHLLTPTS